MNRKMNTLATLLLLVGLLFMLPVTAVAEEAGDATITPASGTCGDNLTWTLDDKGVLTISGTGEMEDYTLRYDSTLGDHVPTNPWGVEVKEAVLETGVTSIGYLAFNGCSNMSSISIPEGVTNIGIWAFAGCSSLNSISIPEGVTSIDDSVFAGCSSLSSITLPDGVTSIGYRSFSNCSNLTSITLPNGVSIIDDYAFKGCSSLCSANIPDSVTSIGSHAFDGCSSLSSLNIPDGVTSIGDYAFSGCSATRNANRNSSAAIALGEARYSFVDPSYPKLSLIAYETEDGTRTFTLTDCATDAVSITVPDGVTIIDEKAFYECSSLSNISIPNGVTSIGFQAFYDCSNLSSISIPDSVTSIGSSAFSRCPATRYASRNNSAALALTKANYSFVDPSYPALSLKAYETEDGTRTFSVTDCAEDVVSVTFPDGVTSIGSSAFSGCSAIRYTSRNSSAALALTKANYSFVDPSYPELSLKAYETEDGTRTFTVTNCTEDVVSVTFPDDVTSIGSSAFSGCSNLSSITIPFGVTSIKTNTFYNCTNLSSITIPDGVTSIGVSAFDNCDRLSSITIPEGVTSIEKYAFYHCDDLISVYIPNSVINIASEAFLYSYPTIYCYEYSYAETWAQQNNKKYVLLDGKELEDYLTITLPETMSLFLGKAKPIAYNVFPQMPDTTLVWASSDENILTVANGVLMPMGVGSAVVTLTVNGMSASCTVTVVAPATLLALPDTIYVVAKQTRTLPLTIEPAGATVELIYETGNTIYASITEDSLLKGGAVGTTTLTVTDQLTGLTATATVRTAYPVTAVSFAPEACAVDPGETLQLTANVTMRTDSCVNELVTFASSDETIAVVDEKGLLTAKASGTVTITATAASGVSGSCTVLVLPAQRSVLPAGLVTIEDEALMGTPISFCVLPGSVSSIGVRAFASCTALKIIEIPAGVTSIAESAFDGCTDLIIVAPQGSTAHTFALNHGFVWMAK